MRKAKARIGEVMGRRAAYALFAAAVAAIAAMAPHGEAEAQVCPTGCPSVVYPCCCPSPCPVADLGAFDAFESTNASISKANAIYGSPAQNYTPVSPGTFASGTIAADSQSIQNALKGAGSGSVSVATSGQTSVLPNLAVPDFTLQASQLPSVSVLSTGTTAGNGTTTPETLSAGTSRIFKSLANTTRQSDSANAAIMGQRQENSRRISLNALSRAMAKLSETSGAAASTSAFAAQIDSSSTLADDLRVNSELRLRMLAQLAELSELQSLRMELDGVGATSKTVGPVDTAPKLP